MFSWPPHKWRGIATARPKRFVSASGISGTVYLPMCSYTCGKNVEYREWNEATRDTHWRSRAHASDRARGRSYMHVAQGADALRRACKSIITGNKTPRITASIYLVNGDFPELDCARALTLCTPEPDPSWQRTFTISLLRIVRKRLYIVKIKVIIILSGKIILNGIIIILHGSRTKLCDRMLENTFTLFSSYKINSKVTIK